MDNKVAPSPEEDVYQSLFYTQYSSDAPPQQQMAQQGALALPFVSSKEFKSK